MTKPSNFRIGGRAMNKAMRIFSGLALAAALGTAAQAFPQFLLYQGRYTNAGVPGAGPVSMEFRITNGNAVACGTALPSAGLSWTSGVQSVALSSGVFSYKLGYQADQVSQDPAFQTINWSLANTTYYIDVCAGGVTLTPHEPIGSGVYSAYASTAGYAAQAGTAASATSAVTAHNASIPLNFGGQSSDPAGAAAGAMYFNTSTKKMRLHNGFSFVDLATGTISTSGPLCRVQCSGKCADTNIDPNNCGFCLHVCTVGQGCVDGSCVTQVCSGAQALCSGSCADLTSDNSNCGACGNTCAACTPGSASCQFCQSSACTTTTCTGGEVACGAGLCVDPTSVLHCGGCTDPAQVAARTTIINSGINLVCTGGTTCQATCGGVNDSVLGCQHGSSCVNGLCEGGIPDQGCNY